MHSIIAITSNALNSSFAGRFSREVVEDSKISQLQKNRNPLPGVDFLLRREK
jgi:hypothetical protein